jgi:DNA-binding transcriptional LysR family regulator
LPRHSRQSLARRLRLQQLMIFEQVVASGSLLAAAGELAMTQPAVSKSIQELEAQVGGALFAASAACADRAGPALRAARRQHAGRAAPSGRDAEHDQAGTQGQVVVGTLISASAALLPEAIVRLRRGRPTWW